VRDVLRQARVRILCVRVCLRLCASASFTAPSDQAGLCICFHQSPVRAGVSAFALSVAFVRVCAFLCRESLFVCARAIVCWRLPLSAGNGAQGLAHGSSPGGAGRRVQASACALADCTRIRVGCPFRCSAASPKIAHALSLAATAATTTGVRAHDGLRPPRGGSREHAGGAWNCGVRAGLRVSACRCCEAHVHVCVHAHWYSYECMYVHTYTGMYMFTCTFV
jgi:hypothetical protein